MPSGAAAGWRPGAASAASAARVCARPRVRAPSLPPFLSPLQLCVSVCPGVGVSACVRESLCALRPAHTPRGAGCWVTGTSSRAPVARQPAPSSHDISTSQGQEGRRWEEGGPSPSFTCGLRGDGRLRSVTRGGRGSPPRWTPVVREAEALGRLQRAHGFLVLRFPRGPVATAPSRCLSQRRRVLFSLTPGPPSALSPLRPLPGAWSWPLCPLHTLRRLVFRPQRPSLQTAPAIR